MSVSDDTSGSGLAAASAKAPSSWGVRLDAAAPEQSASSQKRHLGIAVSALSIIVAFAAGDLAMAAVASGARYFVPTTGAQWLVSATVDSLGAYLLFGLPQLKAWENAERKPVIANDFRTRVSLRILEGQHWLSFAAASLIGGPLAVGLASGYSGHPNGRRRTFTSALILGAFWAAAYLGLASLLMR